MNKIIKATAFAVLLSTSAIAAAEAKEGFYGTVALGAAINSKETLGTVKQKNDKLTFEAGVGYRLDENTRFDLTVSKLPSRKWNSAKISSTAVLANAYYDFDQVSGVKPYVTAGLGFARNKLSVNGESKSKTSLAYQVGGGVGVPMDDNITFDAGYRFTSAGKYKLDSFKTKNLNSHRFLAGIRVAF